MACRDTSLEQAAHCACMTCACDTEGDMSYPMARMQDLRP